MRADEIAKRYAFSREGFQLVGYEEVGLPVYRLTLLVLTQVQKPIPPIEEFVMKSLNVGISDSDEISRFLGLHKQTLNHTLTNLMRSEDIVIAGQRPRLTHKGEQTLSAATLIVPEQRTIDIHYDRLLRRSLFYENYQIYAPRELREQELAEIPAFPVKPPQLDELSFEEVNRLMQQINRITKEHKRELVTIKAIERRTSLFVSAIALKYKSKTDSSIQIGFVVDGRLSEEHETAFARAGLIKKLGWDKYEPEEIPEIQEFAPVDATEQLCQVTIAEQKVQDAERELELSADIDVGQAQESLAQAQEQQQVATQQLQQIPVRWIYVYEHPPLLEEALDNCQERLMIISPWIKRNVVNGDFIKRLGDVLKNGVVVYMGYGYRGGSNDPWAVRDLEHLARQHSNFHLKDFRVDDRQTHAKILLYDNEFVAVTSFNWLSFEGNPNRTFRDEQGALIRGHGLIEQKFSEQVVYFQ